MQKYENAGEEDRLFIMQYKEFINLIINSKCANVKPFSGRFNAADFELLKEKVQKDGKHEDDFEELYEAFVRVSKMMNAAYNKLYAEQREIIFEMKTPAFDIISHLVALVNCNFCGVFAFLNAKLAERANSIQRFSVLSAAKVQSVDSEVGELPLDGALEFQIDMLSMLINYVRYFRTEKYDSPSLTGKKYWDSLKKLLWNANVLCALKDDYDNSVFTDGFIRLDQENQNITFDYFNHENLKLLLAGSNILSQKTLHESRKNCMPDFFGNFFLKKRIRKMTVTNGFINLKFEKGKNEFLEDKAREFSAAIVSYYDYLKDEPLPGLLNATLLEVLSIWVILQGLADYILHNFQYDFALDTKESFGKIPCRISKKKLLHDINVMSIFSRDKIRRILDVFVSTPNSFCDMWNAPLYDCGEYYTFPIFSISQGMSYNIIDCIMIRGGLNLQKRGPLFEKYVADEIKKEHMHGYMRNVFGSRKYERNKGDFQEIDCIVELRDIVVVAELKCIQYPMTPQNHHDCRKRLRQGCEQALIKAKYVKDNPRLFYRVSTTLPDKRIIPVVVTNYPNFTGFSHQGVYIVDSHSFVSYMNTGRITVNLASKEHGNQVVGQYFIYQNEAEFSSNFEAFLQQNPMVEMLKKDIVIKEMERPNIEGYKMSVVYATPNLPETIVIGNEK